MTSHEKRKLKETPTQHNKFWVPAMWFSTLLNQCMEEGRIRDEIHLKTLLDEVTAFKSALGMLYSYDWISIPLVYTQVTTMAVYGFFFACLMGRQYIENVPDSDYSRRTDLYVPLFTLMQFFFYMGWLKVAEVLINPFGEDEDDFETNWIIDRNYQVAMLGVDDLYCDIPVLEKDMYWDDLEPELPYTKSTIRHKSEPFMGSTADFSLDPADVGSQMVNTMETIPENVKVDKKLVDLPTTVATSTVSSPARLRHFLTNISSAFSQESIADPQRKDHINSLHNIKDGIRDPGFYQSPLLQRVKSNSVKRSLSHTEHLSPTKRGGSMSHVNVTSGSDVQPFHSPAVMVKSYGNDLLRVHVNRPGMAPMNLVPGDFYPKCQTSHGSMSSLVTPKDTSVLHPCHPSVTTTTDYRGSTTATDYLKPHIHGTDSRPTSVYQPYNYDQTASESPSITVNDTMYYNHSSEQSDYTNPAMAASAQQATAFHNSYTSNHTNMPVSSQSQSIYPQSNISRTHDVTSAPLNGSDGMVASTIEGQPTTMYTNFSTLQPAHCNSVWSQNGGNMVTSPATVFPQFDNSSVASPDQQETNHVHWADDTVDVTEPVRDDLPPGSEAANTGTNGEHNKLFEAKADSQESIDSTYDSTYDTVNSQQPLLDSAC